MIIIMIIEIRKIRRILFWLHASALHHTLLHLVNDRGVMGFDQSSVRRFGQDHFRVQLSGSRCYCWWLKSGEKTTRDGAWNPINNGINYQPQLVNSPDWNAIKSMITPEEYVEGKIHLTKRLLNPQNWWLVDVTVDVSPFRRFLGSKSVFGRV